jgi:hypothetical protein
MNKLVTDQAVQDLSDSKEKNFVFRAGVENPLSLESIDPRYMVVDSKKPNSVLNDQEIKVLAGLIEDFALISGGAGVLDIAVGIKIARSWFVEQVGINIASHWYRHPDLKNISYATWKSGKWDFTKRKFAQTDIQKSTVARTKLKTVPVRQSADDIYNLQRPDLMTRRLSILNVKTTDHSAVGGGSSLGNLGFAEISAALSYAKLDEVGHSLVRVLHCNDRKDLFNMIGLLTARLCLEKNISDDDYIERDLMRGCVTAAAFDYLEPMDKRPVSARKRAEIIGMPETSYRRLAYGDRVNWIIGKLNELYDDARSKIYEQLVN